MSTLRTVHNEIEFAAALKERAELIEIMGTLSRTALRIMGLVALKWGGVAVTTGSQPDLRCATNKSGLAWESESSDPTTSEAAMLVELVEVILRDLDPGDRRIVERALDGQRTVQIAKEVGRSVRTVERVLEKLRRRLQRMRDDSYSGNLEALNVFRVYKVACNSGKVLVFAKHGDNAPDYLPKVGTEAWEALNGRRVELIKKDVYGKLNDSEREELEELERICGEAVEKAFPTPPANLDSLILLRDKLRAEKAGHGE